MLFIGCSAEEKEGHIEPSFNEALSAKSKIYCELSRKQYEEQKYVGDKCDALLFTALHGLVCDYVSLSQFESQVEPGQWYRSPDHNCFLSGDSDSDISKDMILGAMLFWEKRGDLDAVRRTIAYGQAHDWFMGEAKDEVTALSKTLLLPSGVQLLKDVETRLSSSNVLALSTDQIGVNTGFRAHLDAIGLLLRGKLSGLHDYEVALLKAQARRSPRNALFRLAYAAYDDHDAMPSTLLLLNESIFPKDKLPNNRDNYCTSYLWQRDDDPSDWSACPSEPFKEWSGTDFLIAAYVARGGFNQGVPK